LHLHHSDVYFDFSSDGKVEFFNSKTYKWKVKLVDTGLNTMTGGRIKRIKSFIDDDLFMLTYGDGLSDINLNELLSFHKKNNKILTLTAVNPDGRFGLLGLNNDFVVNFHEKAKTDQGWVNGGFMVGSKKLFDYIKDDMTIFEKEPLETLAKDGQLTAFKHSGFWQPMDTLRDKQNLEKMILDNNAPWIVK
jgi:glucose-1-phosphate cytidylyltransferase